MKFKKTFILICLVVCLFAMASVCASDANDTTIASEDTGLELSASDEVTGGNLQTSEDNTTLTQANDDETSSAESVSEILSEGEGTYYDLRSEIDSGGKSA